MPFDSLPENNPTLHPTLAIPQIVTDLIAARNYLDTNGWCKGTLTNKAKRCAMGAVRQVVGLIDERGLDTDIICQDRQNRELRYGKAINALKANLPNHITTIPAYNDARTTTYNDVRTLFNKTITGTLHDLVIG